MNKILWLALAALFHPCVLQAQPYPDTVWGAGTQEQLQAIEAFMAPYKKKARQTLPSATERFQKQLPPKYAFFVVTKIYKKAIPPVSEQVFAKVLAVSPGGYECVMASETRPGMPYKRGDKILVPDAEVEDWTIVDPKGREEGNLCGKAMDALRQGVIALVFELVPGPDGKWADAKLVGACDAQQQDLLEIVQEPWSKVAKDFLLAREKGKEAGEARFVPILFDVRKGVVVEK